jgi:hypothetical protein
MSSLSTDAWQTIFSFLDVDSCENTLSVFNNAEKAWGQSIFVIYSDTGLGTKHFTSREQADMYWAKILKKNPTRAVMRNGNLAVVKQIE